MYICLPLMPHAKRILRFPFLSTKELLVPKGHVAVYVGERRKKRFVVPISYLNHGLFQELLKQVAEEFEFIYPMGGLTIPCDEDTFLDLTTKLISS
ncbi:Auxin-responsive protein saur24 [Ranunculus cassubicifolius]